MKLVRSITLSLAVASVSAFSVVACGGTVEHAPQTSASAATKAPVGTNTHGLVKLVSEALGEVALRPDQRTEIEKLAQDAESRHAPMLNGRKELMLLVADQLEAGAIDMAALQPKIDRVIGDLEKAQADDRAAIAKLHGILDGEQRNAFVDALEKQLKAKRGEHGKGFFKAKQLADDLKLTEDQRSKIHEVMRESFKEAMKHHGRAAHEDGEKDGAPWHHGEKGHGHHGGKKAMEAFREDKLDLAKAAPPHDIKAMATFGTDRAKTVAEKILPLLTAEQRKLAADKVRAMAASGDASLLVH